MAVVLDPSVGDTAICPGCNERLRLDWADGWRNDNGLTCDPPQTTHSDHIVTLMTTGTES
ncbi:MULTISPECIES: hypothetical protein [Nocardia]|uniref:hypothetical protein n=1 Tax=Nocardia TaxID=1817 RepID=UPI0024557FE4|nr:MULTISPECIES: hypothetical protein [Nocardia]